MSLYAIADLHLPSTRRKNMDMFGARWQNHREKLAKRWTALVEPGDTVVIPGDVTWAMTLEEARDDFVFIDSLPGKKIIAQGNHDYWWGSVTKSKQFLTEIGVESIDFLRTNAFLYEDCTNKNEKSPKRAVICGSRGWFIDEKYQETQTPADYDKIVSRECARLRLSLECGRQLTQDEQIVTYAFLHFPPKFGDFVCQPIIDVMREFGVSRCFWGHIHGRYGIPSSELISGAISSEIISADYLDFYPKKLL